MKSITNIKSIFFAIWLLYITMYYDYQQIYIIND